MAMTRGELKGQVLRLLMKTAEFPGFYTDDKMNDSIQEAMDFVATEMFMADEGWQHKLQHITTAAGTITVPVPDGMAMIVEVRYLFGDIYIPMMYDQQNMQQQVSTGAGVSQYPQSYRIIDNQFYFNGPLTEGGTDYLQIEYMAFPKSLQADTDYLDGHFNRAFTNFMKYRTASILGASVEKFVNPWQRIEADWYQKMRDIIVKRNLQSTPLREFGY